MSTTNTVAEVPGRLYQHLVATTPLHCLVVVGALALDAIAPWAAPSSWPRRSPRQPTPPTSAGTPTGSVAPRSARGPDDEDRQPAVAVRPRVVRPGALGYWGAGTGSRPLTKVLLATVAVVAAAAGWMLFVAPNASADAGPVARWVVELAVLGAAAAGLASIGRPRLGIVLVMLYAANRALMAVWDQ
jgi:hypothetical protein